MVLAMAGWMVRRVRMHGVDVCPRSMCVAAGALRICACRCYEIAARIYPRRDRPRGQHGRMDDPVGRACPLEYGSIVRSAALA